ncbi:MAG TPA: DoxX family protein [Burkholderiales bacterium]|nr:DoxX family protein [Burkholderiales bacterium]
MNAPMLLTGRILLAALFLVAGTRKLMAVAGTAGYFGKLGFPMPEVLVWVVIVVEIGGALLLILGWHARKAAWLLMLFTLIATFAAHRFWEVDAAQYVNQMNHFLKNLAIVGGLLFVAAAGAGSASLDARRRSS